MMAHIRRFFRDRDWREDRVAAYATVGILVFLTSFFWAPTRDFMHVVYGLTFFAPVLLVLLLRKPNFNQYGGWFTGLALIYAGYASISTLWSDAPRLEFFAQHFLFLAVWLAGTAWLASRSQLHIEKLYWILVVGGAVFSVAYHIIFHVQGFAVGYNTDISTRLGLIGFGVTRNPNTIGMVFGATTLVAYVWWMEGKGWREAAGRFFLLLLNGSAVLATQSRGPILALAVSLTLCFVFYHGASGKWKKNIFAALVLFGGFMLAIQQQLIPNRWDFSSMASSQRPEIWQHLVKRTVEEDLWFGQGLVKTTRIHVPELEDLLLFPHAHNAFVDAFYWTGLVGLLLMCAHMLYVLRHWSNSPKMLPLFLWFLFGCLTALVDRPGFFEHLTPHWFVYWIPAGLIAALVTSDKQKSPPE